MRHEVVLLAGALAFAVARSAHAEEPPPPDATVPEGYARAESGRLYQVTFDLQNRVYVGGAWSPTFERSIDGAASPSGFPLGRGRAELGLEVSYLSPEHRSRHDLRILEGSASFSDLQLQGLLLAYDYQHLHRRPGLWLTTFVGEPKLVPITLPLGWGFRVLEIADRPPAFQATTDAEWTELHVAIDPWQSADLYDHVRIEAGADVGSYWEDRTLISSKGVTSGEAYSGPTLALRTRFSLGGRGLHYVTGDLEARRPVVLHGPRKGLTLQRLKAQLAYEGILFAINDQPLSLRLAAKGQALEDPAAGHASVELGFDAGLRFSFWAPARTRKPLPELESQ